MISAFTMSEGDSILIETLLRLEGDCLKLEENEDNSFESEDRFLVTFIFEFYCFIYSFVCFSDPVIVCQKKMVENTT